MRRAARRVALVPLAVLALIWASVPALRAQERFGGLVGLVTDASKAPVPGASVTAAHSDSGVSRTVVTGRDGSFRIADLAPGRYNVTIDLEGFQAVAVNGVIVLLGKEHPVTAELQPGGVSEVVHVTGQAKHLVDLTSVTLVHHVTAEEFGALPKARTFQSLAVAAPGVNSGEVEGGLQVNGASGAENTFTVDGVTTNSLLYGSSRQSTVFEYVQEVQVKTGGIDAQYGGALGGVISAVTRSGGNMLRGEAHYYYSGSAISAGPVRRLQLSPIDDTTTGYFQDARQSDHQSEPGASLGGPIVKNRLFFFSSYSPRLVRRANDYLFSNGSEPGTIAQRQLGNQAFGKLTFAAGRVQANASALATGTRSTGTLPAFNGLGANIQTNSLAGARVNNQIGFTNDQHSISADVGIRLGRSNSLALRGGYFFDSYADVDMPTTTAVVWNTPSIGIAGVPAGLQQPTGFQNTPRQIINAFDTTRTGSFQVDYHHQFAAAGLHRLTGGAGVRRAMNSVERSYPGGYVLLNWGNTFTSLVAGVGAGTGTYGYYEVYDRGTSGEVSANMPFLYVQDAWTIANRLTLNLGVRTEQETIPSFRPEIKASAFDLSFAEKVAPRLGVSVDVLGNGRLKAFASWGRYFDWVKYELARGSFGGDTYHVYYRALDTLDVFGLNVNHMPGRDLWGSSTGFRDRRVPNFNTVDPAIKPMFQDATNAGIEYQIGPATLMGASYVHNRLSRTIEDLGALVNGNEVYVIGNPGEGTAAITRANAATSPFATPRPMRHYDAIELMLSRRLSKNWFGHVNVVVSRLYGNYAGLGKSDEILTPTTGPTAFATAQQQSGSIGRPGTSVGRDWDNGELLWDSRGHLDVVGRLATDRPVVAKFYGAYTFPIGTQVGVFEYVGSGTPVSTYVASANQTNVFVNGRGDLGRTPVLSRTDLLASHEFTLAGTQKLRLELNVLNLFNQKTATHLFNYLNKGAGQARGDAAMGLSSVDLAKGYDYNALILSSASGRAAYDPRYGQADLFQTGTEGQLSVKWIF